MANKINIIAGQYEAFNHEKITVSTAAIGLTAARYTTSNGKIAKIVILTVEAGGQLRYRYDGTDPTSAIGHQVNPYDTIILKGNLNIQRFKAIRSGSADAGLSATFEE